MQRSVCYQIWLKYFVFVLVKSAEALVAATREIGLEVSADKTKYMVVSRDRMQDEITV